MNEVQIQAKHSHVFLGREHSKSERRTWAVIWLCGAMMALEIGGGWLFGSIALTLLWQKVIFGIPKRGFP